ncbi:MAG TPA: PilX N-terminal domain-containing pilus assembly protein [Dyella sp.]|uniref:pilus assembly PilX family protein n=1 Tax=Dyella sp. TaxID=1869338 RepID=UPI002BD22B62|nr:PilX N-terminal domain-containing pilus assembly protein [Dyella sp.]HTV85703.1 PilX N-terminal domain-containing pilus assembly protein [Dyella sp.]
MTYANHIKHRAEGGYILIASLLMLLVLTFLAIGMYHSFTEQELMAANTKEKSRAFQMAQSTLEYGEYLLQNDTNGNSIPQSSSCTAVITTPTICTNAVSIASPTATKPMTLTNGMVYSTMTNSPTISTTGGSSSSYYAYPQVYLRYLGLSTDGLGQVYQVTALGYGGNSNAVAVVQSTYELTTNTKNLGGL